jgi:uncharacterized protein (DUF302 family)
MGWSVNSREKNVTKFKQKQQKEKNISTGGKMTYYFSKEIDLSFDDAIGRVTEELKKEGFGVLTEIDVKATLKKKLDADFRNYRILGACNPPLAHQALKAEPHIGLMLPCNVVVQESESGKTLISAIDPVASMQAVENETLGQVAEQVRGKLQKVIESI